MVTAAVPVFLANGISIAHARSEIIAALETAVQDGRFLNLAHNNNNNNQ